MKENPVVQSNHKKCELRLTKTCARSSQEPRWIKLNDEKKLQRRQFSTLSFNTVLPPKFLVFKKHAVQQM